MARVMDVGEEEAIFKEEVIAMLRDGEEQNLL
jgi:hypothetical protein